MPRIPTGGEQVSPQRVQRKRTKGWQMPEGAVYVGRGSRWGNPFRPVRDGGFQWIEDGHGNASARLTCSTDREGLRKELMADCASAFESAMESGPDSSYWWFGSHSDFIRMNLALQAGDLHGKDLACWCPLDQPCHADVLLKLANPDDMLTAALADPEGQSLVQAILDRKLNR